MIQTSRRKFMTSSGATLNSRFKAYIHSVGHRLHAYHPILTDRHFWAVQGIVLPIAVIHNTIDLQGYLPHLGMLYFVPASLFFVPVVYAALYFGFAGAIATAWWAVLVTVPNWVLWHDGLERLGVLFQLGILVGVAVVVGHRVDREAAARHRAEAANVALGASEMKYHGLFESTPVATFVLNVNGAILDANPAAATLFGRDAETLKSMTVTDLLGAENAKKLLSSPKQHNWQLASLALRREDGLEVYLEPTVTPVSDSQGNADIQVLLRDVTKERQRQAGLKAYTAHVLAAQEEERQRIARELHDDTIQTLSLLHRKLGAIETAHEPASSPLIQEIRDAKNITEEVVDGLRGFTRSLRPPILDDLGLVTSIRRLVLDLTERSGIRGRIELVGEERRLPGELEVGLFRIAQEALRNVERHSRANEVVATMTFTEYEIRLDVRDNGVGFSIQPGMEHPAASGQLGIIGMHERADLLGGELTIHSTPGKGTTVIVAISMPEGFSKMSDRH